MYAARTYAPQKMSRICTIGAKHMYGYQSICAGTWTFRIGVCRALIW